MIRNTVVLLVLTATVSNAVKPGRTQQAPGQTIDEYIADAEARRVATTLTAAPVASHPRLPLGTGISGITVMSSKMGKRWAMSQMYPCASEDVKYKTRQASGRSTYGRAAGLAVVRLPLAAKEVYMLKRTCESLSVSVFAP